MHGSAGIQHRGGGFVVGGPGRQGERVLQLEDLHHHGVGVREEQPHLREEPPHVEVVGLHELGELQRAGADLGGHAHAGLAAVRLERLHKGQEPLRVLAHCLGVKGLNKHQRSKAASCSGSFFYPEMTRRGRRPGGLPTDRPVNFDDIEAFELRNAGRVEVFVFVRQQTLWTDGLEYYHVCSAPRAARASAPAQRALQPDPQLPGAGRQAGADPGSHAHQHRRLHGPLHHEGLVAAPPRYPVLSRDSRAPSESAAARVRYRGKASAELAPLTCYADLKVYSTPAPTVHIAASSCYVAVGRCGYVPTLGPARTSCRSSSR